MNIFFLCSFLWVKRFDCPFHFFSWDWRKRKRVSQTAIFIFNKFILGWSLYLSIIPEIVLSSRERLCVEKLWLFDIFKIRIFIKYSLKFFAISASWDRMLSSSTRIILECILTLSEIFGLTIFQKTRLSVALLMTRLP